MLTSPYFPRDAESFRGLFAHATANSRCIVMQAGHFLLYYDPDTDSVVPCLSEEASHPQNPRIREYGKFPSLTWELGLRTLSTLSQTAKYVMIVVNDWQFIPKTANREQFYRNHPHLPKGFERVLDLYRDGIKLLEPEPVKTGVSTRPFFGKMNLRNYYRREVERLIKRGCLPSGAALRNDGKAIYCDLSDGLGNKKEIYCSGRAGDCSAEIAQMLQFARKKTQCDTFINLYPAVCREFIEYGTSLAEELFSVGFETVLNIGFPSCNVHSEEELLAECEAVLHVKERY